MRVSGDERGKLDAIGWRVIPGELGVGPLTCAFAVVLRVAVLELELGVLGVVLEARGDVGDDDEGSALVDDASLESKPADPCEVPEVAELLELEPVVPDGDAPRLSILWCWPAWSRDKNGEWAHGFPELRSFCCLVLLLPRFGGLPVGNSALPTSSADIGSVRCELRDFRLRLPPSAEPSLHGFGVVVRFVPLLTSGHDLKWNWKGW